MNLYCESCNGTCYCREFEAEQEAIERLQEMPVEEAVMELWRADAEVDVIAKTLMISSAKVLEVLDNE